MNNFFNKVSKWFNGKKVIIGSIGSAFIIYLTSVGYLEVNLALFLGTSFNVLLGAGVKHKIEKRNASNLD